MLTRTNIALALGAFIGSATYADVKEWDPIAGNLFWSTAENWTPTGVPQANDTVYIDGSYTVLLDTDTASLTDVLIHGGASVGTNGFSLTALTPSCGASSVREPGSALTVSPASGLALALDHLFVEDGALLCLVLRLFEEVKIEANFAKERRVLHMRREAVNLVGIMVCLPRVNAKRGNEIGSLASNLLGALVAGNVNGDGERENLILSNLSKDDGEGVVVIHVNVGMGI